jgi:hypothetical protein
MEEADQAVFHFNALLEEELESIRKRGMKNALKGELSDELYSALLVVLQRQSQGEVRKTWIVYRVLGVLFLFVLFGIAEKLVV